MEMLEKLKLELIEARRTYVSMHESASKLSPEVDREQIVQLRETSMAAAESMVKITDRLILMVVGIENVWDASTRSRIPSSSN